MAFIISISPINIINSLTQPLTQSFALTQLPPTMNQIIAMAKPYKGKKCSAYDLAKKRWNAIIKAHVLRRKLTKYTVPVYVHLTFVVNQRIDLDNLRACQKFILDGMVNCKLIVSDSRKWVRDITYEEVPPIAGVDTIVIVTVSNEQIYKLVAIEY